MAINGVEAVLGAGLVASLGLNLYNLREQRRARRAVVRRRPTGPDLIAPSQSALQRLGLVRFNAYNDTGGDYSFCLALLDSTGNGVVVSGLYHRERCRVYAKPVARWDSAYELTDEEREAVERARGDQGPQ